MAGIAAPSIENRSMDLDSAKAYWQANNDIMANWAREDLASGAWRIWDGAPYLVGKQLVLNFSKDNNMQLGFHSPGAREQGLKEFPSMSSAGKAYPEAQQADPGRAAEFYRRRRAIRVRYNKEYDTLGDVAAKSRRDRAIGALETEFADVLGSPELRKLEREGLAQFFDDPGQPSHTHDDEKREPWQMDPDFWKKAWVMANCRFARKPIPIDWVRVKEMILQGLSSPEIASALGVNHYTLSDGIKRVFLRPESQMYEPEIAARSKENGALARQRALDRHSQDPEARRQRGEKLRQRLLNDPELRRQRSEHFQKLWKDPEHRKKMSEVLRQRWKNPEFRQHMVEVTRKLHKLKDYAEKITEMQWEQIPEALRMDLETSFSLMQTYAPSQSFHVRPTDPKFHADLPASPEKAPDFGLGIPWKALRKRKQWDMDKKRYDAP